MTRRVLFVLKKRESYGWGDDSPGSEALSSGLTNSARMVADMLADAGVETRLVQVVDNNDIHREAVAFGATDVVIEAFWVVPPKFAELAAAMPGVPFTVRNHSETPFLASEGVGFGWTLDYMAHPNVRVACNAPRMLDEVRFLAAAANPKWSAAEVEARVVYLPNYYPLPHVSALRPLREKAQHVDVGCFGAIRPLKNHMLQAVAAIRFAERVGRSLRFHINAGRVEMGGAPILANLRGLFAHYPQHELVERPWRPHDAFRELIRDMDLVTQVSFSETFNIVAADAVSQNVATVTSAEVAWAAPAYQADPTSSADIADRMLEAFEIKRLAPRHNPNLAGLVAYDEAARAVWTGVFGG